MILVHEHCSPLDPAEQRQAHCRAVEQVNARHIQSITQEIEEICAR
jgi:hypothetical protein